MKFRELCANVVCTILIGRPRPDLSEMIDAMDEYQKDIREFKQHLSEEQQNLCNHSTAALRQAQDALRILKERITKTDKQK